MFCVSGLVRNIIRKGTAYYYVWNNNTMRCVLLWVCFLIYVRAPDATFTWKTIYCCMQYPQLHTPVNHPVMYNIRTNILTYASGIFPLYENPTPVQPYTTKSKMHNYSCIADCMQSRGTGLGCIVYIYKLERSIICNILNITFMCGWFCKYTCMEHKERYADTSD